MSYWYEEKEVHDRTYAELTKLTKVTVDMVRHLERLGYGHLVTKSMREWLVQAGWELPAKAG